jgi:hypothetical protein
MERRFYKYMNQGKNFLRTIFIVESRVSFLYIQFCSNEYLKKMGLFL